MQATHSTGTVVLSSRHLSVRRGRTRVLTGVSLDLAGGTVAHLQGANGSGKTSLLRVFGGLARPAAGTLARPRATAFVPERVAVVPALACGEWLRAMRRLRGLPSIDWAQVLEASGLDPAVLRRQSAKLSKGMLQRIAIVEAVRSESALLLLDEPFSGLDTDGRSWLGQQLAACRAAAGTVLFTDHSGAPEQWVGIDQRLVIQDATCAADATPRRQERAATVLVRAVKAGGETFSRRLPESASDDLLRELLAGGWHIESVDR